MRNIFTLSGPNGIEVCPKGAYIVGAEWHRGMARNAGGGSKTRLHADALALYTRAAVLSSKKPH